MEETDVEDLLDKIHDEADILLNQTHMHSIENFESFLKKHGKVRLLKLEVYLISTFYISI